MYKYNVQLIDIYPLNKCNLLSLSEANLLYFCHNSVSSLYNTGVSS